MLKRRRTQVLFASAAALLLLVAGCGSKAPDSKGGEGSQASQASSVPRQGGTLTVGRPTDSSSLDPHEGTSAPEVWVFNNIIETLVVMDENLKVQPALAERWEQVDPTTLRFHLKKGVKFHDGTPFNAEAVKFSIERMIDPKKPARGKSWLGPVSGAKVVDEYTVDILTSSPYGPLLNHLTMPFAAGIVSPAAVAKYGDAFGRNPVGTGPFKFAEWQTNTSITLVRNDDYWGQKPYLDKVVFKVIPEAETRSLALERGDIDVLLQPSPTDIAQFKQNKDLSVAEAQGLRIVFVGLNQQNPPFDDRRVREAIAHAVDVEGINSFVLENTMLLPKGVIAPTVFGYADTNLREKYKFDLSKTDELLKQAGYTKGTDGIWQKGGKPLELNYWFSQGRYVKDKEISEAIVGQLTKAGIKVNAVQREWGAFATALAKEKPDYHLYTYGWAAVTGDSDFGLYATFHSANLPPTGFQYTLYKNPQVDQYLGDARVTVDQAKRNELYQKAQQQIVDDVVWLPIYQTKETAVLRQRVQGLVMHPVEYYLRLGGVWLNK